MSVDPRVIPDELATGLARLGITGAAIEFAEPLTGGVSSEIWRIDTADGAYCTKRALAVLKTAQRWEAPVERSTAEANWLRDVSDILPDSVPKLLGFDEGSHTLLLELLDPSAFTPWKAQLLDHRVDAAVAFSVGATLGRIHSSFADPRCRPGFDNRVLFDALRLEPYIERTAMRHRDLAASLTELIDTFDDASSTVIHGDVSPKNILVGATRIVFLDAECATWGDPAFDVAFCLTHLCAKGIHLADDASAMRAASLALLDGYERERAGASPERTARWLAALLLARIDGASPLEYLSDSERSIIRDRARDQLAHPAPDAVTAVERWFDET